MDALSLYLWTVLGGALVASALAIAGCHIASRGRSLQALCVAQGAETGSLAALVILAPFFGAVDQIPLSLGFFGAFAGSFLCGVAALRAEHVRMSSRTVAVFGIWLVLVGCTHLLVAMHPLLESHLSRVFLGDLATLSNQEGQASVLFGTAALLYFVLNRRKMARHTFDSAVLMKRSTASSRIEELLILILCAFSTWSFGFLFTCLALFLPTAVFGIWRVGALRTHVMLCAGVPLVSVPLGLWASISAERLPSSPTVLLVTAGVASLAALIAKKMHKISRVSIVR